MLLELVALKVVSPPRVIEFSTTIAFPVVPLVKTTGLLNAAPLLAISILPVLLSPKAKLPALILFINVSVISRPPFGLPPSPTPIARPLV